MQASSKSDEDGGQRITVDNIRNTKKPDDDLWELAPASAGGARRASRSRATNQLQCGRRSKSKRGVGRQGIGTRSARAGRSWDLNVNSAARPKRKTITDQHNASQDNGTKDTRDPRSHRQNRSAKGRRRSLPVLWTDDDKTEWARREADDKALVEELSQVRVDDEGDASEEPVDRLRDRVYILTFPPRAAGPPRRLEAARGSPPRSAVRSIGRRRRRRRGRVTRKSVGRDQGRACGARRGSTTRAFPRAWSTSSGASSPGASAGSSCGAAGARRWTGAGRGCASGSGSTPEVL